MTPEEERALLDDIGARIERAVDRAYEDFVAKMHEGEPPGSAAISSLEEMPQTIAGMLSEGLSKVTGTITTVEQALAQSLGGQTVEQTLDSTRHEVATIVDGLKRQHDDQFAALRAFAEQLVSNYEPKR